MDRLPDAVVAYLANAFLDDASALRLARASRTLLHALRRPYLLKQRVFFSRASEWAAGPAKECDANGPLPSPLRIGLAVRVSMPYAGGLDGLPLQAQLDRFPSSVQRFEWSAAATESLGSAPVRLPAQMRELVEFNFRAPAADVRLPPTLTTLSFDYRFNRDVSDLRLPDGLRTLRFGLSFRQPLSALRLPASLTELDLEGFDGPVSALSALPPALEGLNSPLDGVALPANLRSLHFGARFNQPIAHVRLPESLTHLTFGWSFNQPLHEVQWPRGLSSLTLGQQWKQSVEHLRLPPSLTQLKLSYYDGPLNWIHPPAGVAVLELGRAWNHPSAQLRLPPSLTAFTLPYHFNQPLDDLRLPATLRSLTLNEYVVHPLSALRMPAGLTAVDLIGYSGSVTGVRWPASLTKLVCSSRCATVGLLPASLLELKLQGSNGAGGLRMSWLLPARDAILPPRLQRLTLDGVVDRPLSDLRLPASLRALTLEGACVNPLTKWTLPEGLRELRLGGTWNYPVGQLRLPPRLEVLAFGEQFNRPVDELSLALPASLTELHLGSDRWAKFAHSLAGLRLPPNLRVLRLPSFGHRDDDPPALLSPPACGLPPALRELHVSERAVRFDRLAAWSLPARCVVLVQSLEWRC